MEFDNLYFNSYISSLLELETTDEIISSLPSKSQDGYEEFLNNAISYINNEIKSNKELKEESKDTEDIEYIEKELNKFDRIREILIQKLDELKKEEIDIPRCNKNIIFLVTNAGNPCIEKDLKDIPGEYCDSLIELFNKLENFGVNNSEFNDIMCKKVTNNSAIKNVFELKSFKVRLYFEQVDEDIVIVLMAAFKNQTNPKSIFDTLALRKSMTIQSENRDITILDYMKEQLSNIVIKESLIEKHRVIKESIIEKLKEKRR